MHRTSGLVSVRLGPSRLARAWIAVVALATLGVALTLPFDHAWQALAPAAPVAWLLGRRCAGRRAARSVEVDLDGRVRVVAADGGVLPGKLRRATYVGTRFVALVWQPSGARLGRAFWILPDMLPADDARRLRLVLRYARSAASQDAPRSHA